MSPVGHKSGMRAAPAFHRALRAALSITAVVVVCNLVVACGRGIGDACETSLRCSASATRLCDMTQPGGYCTLGGCQPGGCPSESVCVTFWQNTPQAPFDRNRLSTTYCMRKCDERSDCRDDEGYDCLNGKEFGYGGEATVEGNANQKFCAQKAVPPVMTMTTADAGTPDAATASN
jgi:hypothetical protein